MEDYLQKLSDIIESKNLTQFCVFPDEKTFKIIKKNKTNMRQEMKKNPKKYAERKIAFVTPSIRKSGLKDKEHIFSLSISIYEIYEDGGISKTPYDSWSLLLKYMPDDLEKHPFNMKSLEKIIKLVYKRQITSQLFGITYKRFEEKLEELKENRKKKASRSIKSTRKRSKKISLKKSKRSKKINRSKKY
jgi:hypothetical protein